MLSGSSHTLRITRTKYSHSCVCCWLNDVENDVCIKRYELGDMGVKFGKVMPSFVDGHRTADDDQLCAPEVGESASGKNLEK